jgi:conjugal transfer pilus assembly protein TraB
LEAKFPSYVVGEDGKAGMRGRLVSKQGQVIARTLVAGFASGVSKAFDVSQVQVLDTSSVGDSVRYQSNWSPQLAQGAAVEGASRALEKVADFYLKMAEQIFPVIEITAGRRVNVIVTAGTKLRLESINELSGDHSSTPTQTGGTIPAPMPSKNSLQTGAAAQAAQTKTSRSATAALTATK